jgi:peptidoglycan/xylan/chitin deacetylase (PgdA/CDA1 family)
LKRLKFRLFPDVPGAGFIPKRRIHGWLILAPECLNLPPGGRRLDTIPRPGATPKPRTIGENGMKLRTSILAAFILTAFTAVRSGTIDAPYSVGTWHGFRPAAVSFTFDDNTPDHFQTVVPMFNEFGFKATLFAVTDWVTNWDSLKAVSDQGFEVASHTLTHPNFSSTPKAQQISEIHDSKAIIETRIPDRKCVTLAYPYCVTGNDSAVRANYIAARICSGSNESSNPANMLWLSSIATGDQGSFRTAASFNTRMKGAVKGKQWVVWLTHRVDGLGWSPTSAAEIRGSLEYLKARQDTFWVAPFGAVSKYILERRAVNVHETAAGDSIITVQVTDTLDSAVFDRALTFRRPLPDGWPFAAAFQNGAPTPSTIQSADGGRFIQFDAVPDGGDVTLVRRETADVDDRGAAAPSPRSYQNYPNPFNPTTTIEFSLPRRDRVDLVLLDVSGRTVRRLADGVFDAGTHRLNLDAGGLPGGVYFYRLNAGTISETKKLVLAK